MSDAQKPDPEEDLMEFLGGIDEVNEEAQDGDFADFLARADIDAIAADPKPKAPPPKDRQQHE